MYIYIYPRDPSTFSEDDWRHSYVGLEGPSTFSEGTWIPRDTIFRPSHNSSKFGRGVSAKSLDSDLGLAIRTKPPKLTTLAHVGEPSYGSHEDRRQRGG